MCDYETNGCGCGCNGASYPNNSNNGCGCNNCGICNAFGLSENTLLIIAIIILFVLLFCDC